MRSAAQRQALVAAAAATKNKALQALLPHGVGFHNAAMEAEDRALVEGLFREGAVLVLVRAAVGCRLAAITCLRFSRLPAASSRGTVDARSPRAQCTTSTLAMGVNLPAHLVVVKGTRRVRRRRRRCLRAARTPVHTRATGAGYRPPLQHTPRARTHTRLQYVGLGEAAQGQGAGYAEYARHEVLQMVGRAGRPQFDTEARARQQPGPLLHACWACLLHGCCGWASCPRPGVDQLARPAAAPAAARRARP